MSTRPVKKRPAALVHPPEPRAARTKIVDVAREAGVSITTVSHALNGRGQVDPRTREAVQQVAQRLGYRPNRHAQRLRSGGSNIIALVSSMPFAVAGGPSRLGFMMEIAAVAASVALERGLALILVPPSERGAALDHIEVDGAIVIEPAIDDAPLAHLVERGIPVVAIGRPPGSRDLYSCVDLRSAETTRQLLEHLRARGARRIALLTGAQARSPYTEAIAAYDAFATQRRMRRMVVTVDENGGEEAARQATLDLLGRHTDVDAICAPVDALAAGAVRALHESGKAIPQQVMLATRYDGLRARESVPPLTALDLHLEEVATAAIELLLGQLQGDTAPRIVLAPDAQLIERGSTFNPAG